MSVPSIDGGPHRYEMEQIGGMFVIAPRFPIPGRPEAVTIPVGAAVHFDSQLIGGRKDGSR